MSTQICHIIAGPNGAGKTTFAMRFLPQIAASRAFLNADEIARGLSPLDIAAGNRLAARLFLQQLEEKLRQKKPFAFETTLSGKSYLQQIPQWQKQSWQVVLHYLWVPDSDFSAHRVQQRVAQGGHDIPLEDIRRRYPRSLENLFLYAKLCDQTYCYDNSENSPRLIFSYRNGIESIIDTQLYKTLKDMTTMSQAQSNHLFQEASEPYLENTALQESSSVKLDDDFGQKCLECLREAVREELERKAKLGQMAVVADKNHKAMVVPAKLLVRKMRQRERAAARRAAAKKAAENA